MPVYAYRWADGSVSVCSARNKGEAAWLFDEVGEVSRKLIIRLKAEVLFTCRLDVNKGWLMDGTYPLGEKLSLELPEKCYPRYDAAFDKWVERSGGDKLSPKDFAKLRKALAKDVEEAGKRMDEVPQVPEIFKLTPKGFPGQNN